MSDDVDIVAEALFKLLTPNQLHGDWVSQPDFSVELYRRMAEAAIDALENRENVRWCSYCDGTGIVPGSENQVWVKGQGWEFREDSDGDLA